MLRRGFLKLLGLASIATTLGIKPVESKLAEISEVYGTNTFIAELPEGCILLRENMTIHVDTNPVFNDYD